MTIENEGQEAPNTVHDDVRAAITQLKEADTEVKVDNADDTVVKETVKVDKDRNEKGQFNKKEKPEVKAETDTEVKPAEVKDKVEEKPKVRVPRGLKAHLQAKFTELSPEWQTEIERIDRAGEEGYRKVADRVKYAESIENEIKPYEHILRAEGVDHQTAVREMIRVAALLRIGTPQQKQQWLLGTAQHFGIQLPQAQSQGQEQQQTGIESHPLLQNLFNEVNTLKSGLQQRQEQEKQALYGSAYNAVSSFMEEVDENGIPKHPIDPSNEMDLVAEVKTLREKHPDWDGRRIMEAAYENFSWKIPELRDARLAKQAAEQEAKRKKQEAEAIAAKKNAAGSIRGSATSTTGKYADDSVRGLITAQIRGNSRI